MNDHHEPSRVQEHVAPQPPPPTGALLADPPATLAPALDHLPEDATASVATWLYALGAAIMLDLAIQGDLASLAGSLAVVAAAATIWTSSTQWSASRALSLALAIVASTNFLLRTSLWVTIPTAIAVATLLVIAADDRLLRLTTRGTASAVLRAAGALVDVAPFLSRPVRRWFHGGNDERAAVIRGALVAAGVAGTLTLMLANGDAVFGSLFSGLGEPPIWAHSGIVIGLFIFSLALAILPKTPETVRLHEPARLHRTIEALMGLAAMVLVLGVWATTQLIVALGGADRLLATEELTRADYARRGFFELVAVVAVALTLLGLFGSLLGREQRRLGSVLALSVASLVLVLVGVTFSRLALYIDAFGLTMLRLAVAWFLGWMAVMVIAVGIRAVGVGGRRPWVAATAVVSAALVSIGFGWSNPEASVVTTNVAHAADGAQLDLDYLDDLGTDAAPALASHLPGSDAANRWCEGRPPQDHYGWFGWNLSRSRVGTLEC